MKIIIGTRGSRLALWQAHHAQQALLEHGVESELKIISTKGDQIQHLSFDKIEGKGFFTKELEDALLSGEIDMAVHSMKDMPTTQPEGLSLAGVSYREDPADWIIARTDAIDASQTLRLKHGATIGTSSSRRKAQLLDYRPDLNIVDIRGNVPTRVGKIDAGVCDAVMLAAAGLTRLELDLSAYEIIKLHPREFVPAPAQGVMAYQIRREDQVVKNIVKKLHKETTSRATNVERKTLKLLDGGCQMPAGIYCENDSEGNFHVWAVLAESWDAPVKRVKLSSSTSLNLAEKVKAALTVV